MVLLNCQYGNNNIFTMKIVETIEYGQLYQIFARVLNIKETNIAYIIYSGKIIGSKQLPFTDELNLHYPIISVFIQLGNSVKMTAKYLHYSIQDSDFELHENGGDMFSEKITDDVFYKNIIIIDDSNEIEKNDTCFCGDLLCNEYHAKCARLKCGHIFHENCIKNTIVEYDKRECPLCGANSIMIW